MIIGTPTEEQGRVRGRFKSARITQLAACHDSSTVTNKHAGQLHGPELGKLSIKAGFPQLVYSVRVEEKRKDVEEEEETGSHWATDIRSPIWSLKDHICLA
ncbi:hypothetical protein XENOCAPTIV_016266 [Xenoophorus captivus]|uniref:Uncharacterized protein n=1 Tax=Xenoophorus captivus TaxID=1517983 RepID=A0ABV0QM34_9TELE